MARAAPVLRRRMGPRRRGPAREHVVGEPRRPAAPIERLAADAVGLARKNLVAPPSDAPDELARLRRLGRFRQHGLRYFESDGGEVLNGLGDEERAGLE